MTRAWLFPRWGAMCVAIVFRRDCSSEEGVAMRRASKRRGKKSNKITRTRTTKAKRVGKVKPRVKARTRPRKIKSNTQPFRSAYARVAIAGGSLLLAILSLAGMSTWFGSARAIPNRNQNDTTLEATIDAQLQPSRDVEVPPLMIAPRNMIPSDVTSISRGVPMKARPEPRRERRVAPPRRERIASASPTDEAPMGASSGSSALIEEARRYIGGNPTGRRSLWCGAFMDMVLRRTGHRGGGNLALGYLRYGERVAGPQVGAIAVLGRRGGGHVGVVSGIDAKGNPIVISGNHNRRVAESTYPRRRIIAYVIPR
jgi:uncharacterized protein (TIGR02594 family)